LLEKKTVKIFHNTIISSYIASPFRINFVVHSASIQHHNSSTQIN